MTNKETALLPETGVTSKSLQRFVGGMFENFVSEGSVWERRQEVKKTITVLRCTGDAQSLLLNGVLPVTDEQTCTRMFL